MWIESEGRLIVGTSKIIATHLTVTGGYAGERVRTVALDPQGRTKLLECKARVAEGKLTTGFGNVPVYA
jgi:hypothetical protein